MIIIGGNIMIEKLLKYDFDKIFDLMEVSFPSDEYRTYDEQKALLDNPFYQVYVLKDSYNNFVMAFVAVWEFEDFAFIEHFAVNPEYRNGGIGEKILNKLVDMLGKTICLEVEPPEDEITILICNRQFQKVRMQFHCLL
jgi:ribosomal protein S18 acetylase RimI-like enzyme